jgi:hypothetical protein
MICIYCLQDKSADCFQNRDHVMPQCFGKFAPENLVLRNAVCDECNQYFGNKIELYLGRDTIEGIERYKHGIKPEKQPKHKRLKFKIAEGVLAGIIVTPKYSGDKEIIDNEPLLQVGIINKTGDKFVYYEPHDIPDAASLESQGRSLKGLRCDFIAKDDKELNFLIEKLRKKGYKNIKLEQAREWPECVRKRNSTLVAGHIQIDRIIYRGLSKIAFNYLCYIKGVDFVLVEDFNPIREFIRFDRGNADQFFFVNQPPILHNDRILGIRETRGHLIVIGWKGLSLQVRLSPFNLNTYLVRLCNNFHGIWMPIKNGHHFDVASWTINQLMSVNRRLLPGYLK